MVIIKKTINGYGPYVYSVTYENGKHNWEYLGKAKGDTPKNNNDVNNTNTNDKSNLDSYADRKKLDQNIQSTIEDYEKSENVKVERVIAFGSAARGDARPNDSDLDILLVTSNPNGENLSPSFEMDRIHLQEHIENNADEILENSESVLNGMDVITEIPENADIRLRDKLMDSGELGYKAIDVSTGEQITHNDIG